MSTRKPIPIAPEQARQVAQAIVGLRGAIGVAAFLLPRVVVRPWVGAGSGSPAQIRLLGRALGGRDLALAAGAFVAMGHDGPARGWIEAGALADTGDVVATLLAFPHLPKRMRWAVLALTLGAIAAAYVVAPNLDDAGSPGGTGEEDGPAEASSFPESGGWTRPA